MNQMKKIIPVVLSFPPITHQLENSHRPSRGPKFQQECPPTHTWSRGMGGASAFWRHLRRGTGWRLPRAALGSLSLAVNAISTPFQALLIQESAYRLLLSKRVNSPGGQEIYSVFISAELALICCYLQKYISWAQVPEE